MNQKNNINITVKLFLVLSLINLSSCSSYFIYTDDDRVESFECWEEVEWNKCDISRRNHNLFERGYWEKCPDWSCE